MADHSSWESQVAPVVLTVQLEKTLVNVLNYYYFLAYLHPTGNRKTANIYPMPKGWPMSPVTSAEFSYQSTMISDPTHITCWSPNVNNTSLHTWVKLEFWEKQTVLLTLCCVPNTQDSKVSFKEDIKITDYVPNAFLVLKSKILVPSLLPKGAQPL